MKQLSRSHQSETYIFRIWPWNKIGYNLNEVDTNKSKNFMQTMTRLVIGTVLGRKGNYGHGDNPAWTTKVWNFKWIFGSKLSHFKQVPVSMLQSEMSRGLAGLTGDDMVCPADFVAWEHMKLTSKESGTSFTKGPQKQHLLLGAKWIPLKVSTAMFLLCLCNCWSRWRCWS